MSPRSNLLVICTFVCAAATASAQTKATGPATAKQAAVPKPTAGPFGEKSSDAASNAVLYVPGAYQDWKPDAAPQIGAAAGAAQRFEGYVNFAGTGEQPFKFTDAPDWTHTNYGNAGSGVLTTDGNAAGLTLPAGGYYELTVDLNKKTWTGTKTTWSLIGNATPGGWEKDTPMTYDAARQVWTATVAMKADGSFKFRANNAWKIDFALDGEGKLQYADNPFYDYNSTLKDLTVPDDGTYVITLDLHNPGKYTYSLVAK